jgi:hypothetical protein
MVCNLNHVSHLFDDLFFVKLELLELSVFRLCDLLYELAFKFINALLQRVEVTVDCLEVPRKLIDKVFCVLHDDTSDVILDFSGHFREEDLDSGILSLVDQRFLHFNHRINHFGDPL